MSREEQEAALLRVKMVFQHLREIDQESLSEAEQEALTDVLASVYDRAAHFLTPFVMQEKMREEEHHRLLQQ
jgi:hypothetical protein